MNKKVAFASDHAGFKLKQELENYLKNLGYEIVDLGPNTDSNSVSYTLQGNKLADYINQNNPEFGIGICGTGLGISYALNRHKHIR
ncbi:ribose-5-phosphate isomerase, partial [Mycoplasmopsis pullorum]